MTRTALREEFMETIIAHEAMIHKIVNIYASGREEREDLKQEIIYQLWKSWDSFEQRSKIQTWMYRVALNTALYQRKKPRMHSTSLDEGNIPSMADEPGEERQADIQRLFSAIQRLPELDRAVIMLSLEKFTYAQIGEIIGLTEKNVSVRIHRIKLKLKEMLSL